jgi:Stage II sporulation protein E (SpoIIE)
MPESDSAATQMARVSRPEEETVDGIGDLYLREQLEKRRDSLKIAISTIPATDAPSSSAPFLRLLDDVEVALRQMQNGTYGLCDVCHDSVEKDRLIADPLVRLCLDHLTTEEQRALERDLELAAQVQRGLLPPTDVRHRDWRIHYFYRPAGMVSGDYCDLIQPAAETGKLIFLLGDVSGKGVAASLLMTHLHAMFRALSGIGLEHFGSQEPLGRGIRCRRPIARYGCASRLGIKGAGGGVHGRRCEAFVGWAPARRPNLDGYPALRRCIGGAQRLRPFLRSCDDHLFHRIRQTQDDMGRSTPMCVEWCRKTRPREIPEDSSNRRSSGGV